METLVRPFLMFEGNAEEALDFYVSVFPNSEVLEVVRYESGQTGREGTIMKAIFTVAGQSVMCTDSPTKHGFTFTPSFSFFVDCESVEQIAHFFATLGDGGKVMMPLSDYGFSRSFAWVSDRFGVSWQLNLP